MFVLWSLKQEGNRKRNWRLLGQAEKLPTGISNWQKSLLPSCEKQISWIATKNAQIFSFTLNWCILLSSLFSVEICDLLKLDLTWEGNSKGGGFNPFTFIETKLNFSEFYSCWPQANNTPHQDFTPVKSSKLRDSKIKISKGLQGVFWVTKLGNH